MRTRWTYEILMDVAKRYSTFKDFRRENNDAFLAARRHNWIDDIKKILLTNVTKWSDKDVVLLEARKYATRYEFIKGSKGAYEACVRNNWLDEACVKMLSAKKWTIELCIEDAKKYEWKTDFIKKSPGAYNACIKLKCLTEVTKDLKVKSNRNRTKEDCIIEAKKYSTRKEFKIHGKGAFLFAYRKGWLEEICVNMKEKPVRWNYELCKKEALKYNNRTEFSKNCGSAYGYALTNNFLNDICCEMEPIGNLFKRMIYAYEFPDNRVYIGLTYNEKKRKSEHLTDGKGPVAKYIKKTGLDPEYKKLNEYTDEKTAKILEQSFIDSYKERGWIILNSTKAGALGGNATKWTKEECKKVALFYSRRTEFQHSIEHYTAYSAAAKHGWLDYVCEHMKVIKVYWNKESCVNEAKKYKSKTEFMRKSGGAYNYARKHDILELVCSYINQS
jgi:hypothetical protein